MKENIRRFLICFSALLLFSLSGAAAYADGGYFAIPAEEYSMMTEEGRYPTEVTFADTVFTNHPHAPTASVLQQLNGAAAEEHTFTIKAGDRVDFTLEGDSHEPRNPFDSLISWKIQDSSDMYGYEFIGVHVKGDGLYLIRKKTDAYRLQVSGFGFDTDLSDLSAHAVMTMEYDAHKLLNEDEIPAGSDYEYWPSAYIDSYFEEGLTFEDTFTVQAEGNVTIAPFENYTALYYLEDAAQYIEGMDTTDSVGFQFIFDDSSAWNVTIGGSEVSMDMVSYAEYVAYGVQPYELTVGDVMYYKTLSIVLVGSDLVEREKTVVDYWNEQHPEEIEEPQEPEKEETVPEEPEEEIKEPEEEIKEPEPEEPEKPEPPRKNVRPIVTRKLGALPALAGLTILTAAIAAGMSMAASSASAAVTKEDDDDEEGKEDSGPSITLNEGEKVPEIFAGSESYMTMPVTLETDVEGLWIWNVLVLSDDRQKETMPKIMAEITGDDKTARIAIKAENTGYDYGAVVRIIARSAEQDVSAQKAFNISVLTPGLSVKETDGKVKVTFRTESEIPGTADSQELKENEYKVSELEDGAKQYSYKEHTAVLRQEA